MYERVSISLLEKNFVKAQKLRAKLSKMPLRYSSTLFNSFFISHQKNFSSNQLFSNFFSKIVTFTNFLPKMHFFVSEIYLHTYVCMYIHACVKTRSCLEISIKSTRQ